MTVTGARSDANDSKAYWIQMTALRFPESYGGQPETPLDQDSARAALDELFTLAGKYNSSDAYLELMRFVGRFPFYSPFNAMLIYTQMPGGALCLHGSQVAKRLSSGDQDQRACRRCRA
jgi:hypothetical protein